MVDPKVAAAGREAQITLARAHDAKVAPVIKELRAKGIVTAPAIAAALNKGCIVSAAAWPRSRVASHLAR